MAKVNKPLKRWMSAASTEQQQDLALMAGTTVGTLRHLTTGHRSASSDMAIRLEKAASNFPALPTLTRGDLNSTCKGCDYAKRCRALDKV